MDPLAARARPRGLGLARRDGGDGGDGGDGVRQRHLLALLTDIDDGALGQAEVSTKVVDALHPSFAGVV